jgi:hypothetical protein
MKQKRYASWLQALTEADEPFAISEIVLAAVIRIATNPTIVDPPVVNRRGGRILSTPH